MVGATGAPGGDGGRVQHLGEPRPLGQRSRQVAHLGTCRIDAVGPPGGYTGVVAAGERERLRLLRAAGDATPVLLFADLDDAERATYLERSFAPVEIVPSNEGLLQTAERMRRR